MGSLAAKPRPSRCLGAGRVSTGVIVEEVPCCQSLLDGVASRQGTLSCKWRIETLCLACDPPRSGSELSEPIKLGAAIDVRTDLVFVWRQ